MNGTVAQACLLSNLNPFQLGIVYESLLLNKVQSNEIKSVAPESESSYDESINEVREAIDCNCGWNDYVDVYQVKAKTIAELIA